MLILIILHDLALHGRVEVCSNRLQPLCLILYTPLALTVIEHLIATIWMDVSIPLVIYTILCDIIGKETKCPQ